MHCITLAEVAAILSQHGPDLISSQTEIRSEAVTCYWASSRRRIAIWHGLLAEHRAAQRVGDTVDLRFWWDRNMPLLEEIIVSEMLTRVVAAVTAEIESANASAKGRDEVSPVTHTIFLAHLDVSHRVHRLMIHREGYSVHHAVRLNRLRQGVQRWNDALIGRLSMQPSEALAFAFDHDRAATFAKESRERGVHAVRNVSCWLMNASMRDMLSRRVSTEAAFPEANQDVADSVMSMLQPELFDDLGTLKSGWLHRIGQEQSSPESMPEFKKPNLDWSMGNKEL
ncbi:hypothetical protein [Planctomycetes bacterium K23_9]|uniref:Uncharacterized protein n=1 Tax=Stieleria marina TaxID=1930275 RepID=A0A517NVR9_9BACT|nr:hypothetical protein K239x_32210 [Planctomycetes bacterium K23_9]